jgi:4-hydroxybenzoate polyprenyltransferase
LRPKNWLKNICVFSPLVFSKELFDPDKLSMTIIACAAFCLMSSAVYIFNDICDSRKDAEHPIKCQRPLASGAISKNIVVLLAVLLSMVALAISFAVNLMTLILVGAYFVWNLLYSLLLKHFVLVDCFCIAASFILRVYTGSAACGEPVSEWLFLTIVAMALFLAFGKRRGEILKTDGLTTRDVLPLYNLAFLNGTVFVFAGLAIVFYSLWAMVRGLNMVYTVPVVIFIVCKYLLLVHDESSHGDPTTVIFADKTLLTASGVYVLLTIALLYGG